MNANNRQAPSPSLRELYSNARRSNAWDDQQAEIVRFWTDDGNSWGVPISTSGSHSLQRAQQAFANRLGSGDPVIAGPKVVNFYDDFCSHRASSLRADDKDILSVKMILNAERDA